MAFEVFVRNWWKENPDWPDGREPCIGKKKHICVVSTRQEAREICKEYNDTHISKRLGRKAEFDEI